MKIAENKNNDDGNNRLGAGSGTMELVQSVVLICENDKKRFRNVRPHHHPIQSNFVQSQHQ